MFKKTCFDNDGNINLKLSQDEFITNILADPSFIERYCYMWNIPINKENFDMTRNIRFLKTTLARFINR